MSEEDLVPLLVPLLLAFLLVACWCGYEIYHTYTLLVKDPDMSSGMAMRQLFYVLLLAGNLSRFASLLSELYMYDSGSCPANWTCGMVRSLPDLIFTTLFSLLILFWAQLSYSISGTPFLLLRPLFMGGNVVLYAVFLVFVVLSALKAISSSLFMKLLYFELGIAYLLVFLFNLYYGVVLFIKLRAFSGNDLSRNDVALRRLVILCVICGTIVLINTTYFIGVASNTFNWPSAYPPSMSRHGFDFLFYSTGELAPSVLILVLTRKSSTKPPRSRTGVRPHPNPHAHTQEHIPYEAVGGGYYPDRLGSPVDADTIQTYPIRYGAV